MNAEQPAQEHVVLKARVRPGERRSDAHRSLSRSLQNLLALAPPTDTEGPPKNDGRTPL
jgi:hypothetical protein